MGFEIERGDVLANRIRSAFKTVIIGLDRAIETVMVGMFTPGDIHHVMFEGDPGVGKTLLAEVAARSIASIAQRGQGAADLMPQSFTGWWSYDPKTGLRILKPGMLTRQPWNILRQHFDLATLERCDDYTKLPGIEEIVKEFYAVFLYDEANRTNEQANGSAFVEFMQENKTTVEGVPIPMNPALLVIMDRNKIELRQTFDLPAAMWSRIGLQDELWPPNREEARELVENSSKLAYQRKALALIEPIISVDELLAIRDYIDREVKISPAMVDYIVSLVGGTNQAYLRDELGVKHIVLPNSEKLDLESERIMKTDYPGRTAPGRVMITLAQIAKAAAYLAGARSVRPGHVKRIFERAIMHHIFLEKSAERRAKGSEVARAIVGAILEVVDEPRTSELR